MTVFTDTTGNIVSLPISFTTSYNILSFDVQSVLIKLFTSATLYITLYTDSGLKIPKSILLAGDDYSNWGADDNYLMNYIINNIHTIYNS